MFAHTPEVYSASTSLGIGVTWHSYLKLQSIVNGATTPNGQPTVRADCAQKNEIEQWLQTGNMEAGSARMRLAARLAYARNPCAAQYMVTNASCPFTIRVSDIPSA